MAWAQPFWLKSKKTTTNNNPLNHPAWRYLLSRPSLTFSTLQAIEAAQISSESSAMLFAPAMLTIQPIAEKTSIQTAMTHGLTTKTTKTT